MLRIISSMNQIWCVAMTDSMSQDQGQAEVRQLSGLTSGFVDE